MEGFAKLLAAIALAAFPALATAKCIFGHTKGEQYVVEQTYHSSDNLKFVYTCSSRKFDEDSPEFFFYQLDSCTAKDEVYKPGDRWRNGAFMYECFFRVSKEEGSISEVRHVGCYVQEFLIEKDVEALIGNYRFACDELGLHPITCVSTKEGIEMTPGETFSYGLDSYSCNETDTGLSLEERTKEEECVLNGRVAVAYLIDTSESIKEKDFDRIVRPAVAKELASLPDTFQVRLTVYSTNWKSHTGWLSVGGQKEKLAALVQTMPYLGEGTKTAASLLKTAKLFDEVKADAKFIVMLTDGEARDRGDIPEVVRQVDQKGIKVVSVGIGAEIKAEELEEYGYSIIELQGLADLETALGKGIVRCKIFERLVKIRDGRRQCERWAEEDVPMEPKFMPPCPATSDQAEVSRPIFERLVKIRDGRRQCERWAEEDVPMEPKFMPPCPATSDQAEVSRPIFERLVKIRDGRRQCERWAEEDVPMEPKFMPPCPATSDQAEVSRPIFERLVKIRDGRRQCERWAEEDVPMEPKFMPPCPATSDQAEVSRPIFERLVKIRDGRRQCERWAEEDVPMEPKFMPPCPATSDQAEADESTRKDASCTDRPAPSGPGWKNCQLNRGASVCYHTKFVGIRYGGDDGKVYRSRNQCCYGSRGELLTTAVAGAGSADKASQLYVHVKEDLRPHEYCKEAGMVDTYNLHRPPGLSAVVADLQGIGLN